MVWFYSPKGMDGQVPTWAELTEGEGDENDKNFKIESLSGKL